VLASRASREIGATRRFPRGKIAPDDEGEIKVLVAGDVQSATVFSHLGKPVELVGFTAAQAIDLAADLCRVADEIRGIV
jgi:hypothetical protein